MIFSRRPNDIGFNGAELAASFPSAVTVGGSCGATGHSGSAVSHPSADVAGASTYTNPISYGGFKFFPEARLPFRVLGTNRIFGVLGRLNPWIGAGLLAYDAYNIGSCVSECMKRGFCPTGGQ